jgi:hypothetical protein
MFIVLGWAMLAWDLGLPTIDGLPDRIDRGKKAFSQRSLGGFRTILYT